MALIWMDGFDHYGTDTARMTEGPYDQVDAAFTLSQVNPRTGARCLRRDSSSGVDKIIKNIGSERDVLGSGVALSPSSLPTNDDAYAVATLIDSASQDQITFAINSDGSVVAKLGDVQGHEIASSSAGLVEPGKYLHFEFACRANVLDPTDKITVTNQVDESQLPLFIADITYGGAGIDYDGSVVRKLDAVGSTSTAFNMRRRTYDLLGNLQSTELFDIQKLDNYSNTILIFFKNSAEYTAQRKNAAGFGDVTGWFQDASLLSRPIKPPIGNNNYYSVSGNISEFPGPVYANGNFYSIGSDATGSQVFLTAWAAGASDPFAHYELSANNRIGLASDCDGGIWAWSSEIGKVLEFDENLNLLNEYTGSVPSTARIAVYGKYIVYTLPVDSAIYVVRAENGVLTSVGTNPTNVAYGSLTGLCDGYFTWDSNKLYRLISPSTIPVFADGIVEVRLNGVSVISISGIATRLTDEASYSGVTIMCGGTVPHGVTTDIDDFYIWDDRGAWNNSFLGDRRCYLLKPNQDTNIADFDPSSGSFGYKMIDDDSPDDDSTYIIAEAYLQSGSPLTGTSEFEIEDLPNGASLISAVNVVTRASKTDETSAEIFTSINSGANSLSEDAHILTTSYQYYNDIYEYDPLTISSLTRDGFNDLSISITADDLDPGVSFDSPEDIVSPSEVSDPFFSNVSLLMHYEGADASTTFTDEIGNTITANGNAQIDTADFKFGASSGLFDGTNSYLSTPKNTSFEFGTGDFTLEIFVKITSITATQSLLYYGRKNASGSNEYAFSLIQAASGGGNGIVFTSNGTLGAQQNTISNVNLTINTWQFIQVVRESNVTKIYLDGTQIASQSDTINHNVSATHELLIGRRGDFAPGYFGGWIDETRITKGIARANSVPTQQFPDS